MSTATADGPGTDRSLTVDRVVWTLVWLAVTVTGFGSWDSWSRWPGAAWVAPGLVLAGTVGMASTWWTRPWSAAGQAAGLVVAEVAWVVPQAGQLHALRYQTSDAAAFTQVATRLLAQGHDPYAGQLTSATGLLHPAAYFWTYTADGGHVLRVSYPAGSFLLQAPLYLLGVHHALTDWVDVTAWAVSAVLLFLLLPVWLRWLAPTLLLTGIFSGLFAAGGTDALFVPFVVLAAWRWDRFGRPGAGTARWLGPVALGVACSVKQTPWFAVPLLACCVAIEARRSGRRAAPTALAYLGVVATVFLVINVPFIVWGPGAWLHGTLLPFVEPLVADGQGLVTLALHGVTGGVVLPWLSAAAALVYLALVAGTVLRYPVMKRAWPFLLAVVLFVPGRSFASYLVDLVPAALLAAVTVADVPTSEAADGRAHRYRAPARWPVAVLVGGPLVAAAVACAVAFTSVPLAVVVDGVRTADHREVLVGVTVTVRNVSSRPLSPHFLVDLGTAHPDGFWEEVGRQGPWPVPPGGRTTVELRPPVFLWSPDRGTDWLAEAYTTGPTALSTSALQRWSLTVPDG